MFPTILLTFYIQDRLILVLSKIYLNDSSFGCELARVKLNNQSFIKVNLNENLYGFNSGSPNLSSTLPPIPGIRTVLVRS